MQPPFSPVLLAGMFLPPQSDRILQPLFAHLATKVWKRHKKCFDRLSPEHGTTFAIDPVDLPFTIRLTFFESGPRVVLESGPNEAASAVIRGSLSALVQLAEGKVDGDALFFSRNLDFEGDTEAVVALRNALDDADLDLVEEFVSLAGPLSKPLNGVRSTLIHLERRARSDMSLLQESLLAPLTARMNAQARQMETMDERLVGAEKKLRRTKLGVL